VALKNSPIVVFNQARKLRHTWNQQAGFGLAEQDYIGRTLTLSVDKRASA
jgi:hypothetical protein